MKIGEPDEIHCIYVGMQRPANPVKVPSAAAVGVWRCPCGSYLSSVGLVHDHWRRGHFDVPVYASLREMNEARGMMYADQSVWRPLMPFYAPKSDPKPGEIGAPCAVHHGAEVKTIGGPPAERMYPCCHGTGILKVDQNACQHYFAPNRPHCCDKCGKMRYGLSETGQEHR